MLWVARNWCMLLMILVQLCTLLAAYETKISGVDVDDLFPLEDSSSNYVKRTLAKRNALQEKFRAQLARYFKGHTVDGEVTSTDDSSNAQNQHFRQFVNNSPRLYQIQKAKNDLSQIGGNGIRNCWFSPVQCKVSSRASAAALKAMQQMSTTVATATTSQRKTNGPPVPMIGLIRSGNGDRVLDVDTEALTTIRERLNRLLNSRKAKDNLQSF